MFLRLECFGECEEERGGAGWFRGEGGFAERFGVRKEEGDDGGAVRDILVEGELIRTLGSGIWKFKRETREREVHE